MHAVSSFTSRVHRTPFLDGLYGISAFITAVNGISINGLTDACTNEDVLGTSGVGGTGDTVAVDVCATVPDGIDARARGLTPIGRSRTELDVTGKCAMGMTGSDNSAPSRRSARANVLVSMTGDGGGMMLGGSSPGCGQSMMATCGTG